MFLRLVLCAAPIMLILDMLWINVLAKDLYQQQIGFLLAEQPNIVAAISFYLIYLCGLVFFAIEPAVQSQNMRSALGRAGFFGFVTYATYDLTNLATVKGWPIPMTLIDLAWGTSLCAIVSYVVFRIALKLGWR